MDKLTGSTDLIDKESTSFPGVMCKTLAPNVQSTPQGLRVGPGQGWELALEEAQPGGSDVGGEG